MKANNSESIAYELAAELRTEQIQKLKTELELAQRIIVSLTTLIKKQYEAAVLLIDQAEEESKFDE